MRIGRLTITGQDVLTFVFGALAALAVTVAEHADELSSGEVDTVTELQAWGIALATGLLTAFLRYVATYIPQWLARGEG